MKQNSISVELKQSPTELYKILKFEGLASSGAEAKQIISNGLVTVNGQIETQKRKKIVSGNIIEYNDQTLHIL